MVYTEMQFKIKFGTIPANIDFQQDIFTQLSLNIWVYIFPLLQNEICIGKMKG